MTTFLRFFSILLLCLSSTLPGLAQITDVQLIAQDTSVGRVSAVGNWKTGEFRRYVFKKKRNVFKDTTLVLSQEVFNHISEVTVLDSTASAYQMGWKILANDQDSSQADASDDVDWGLVFDGVNEDDLLLRYRTDEMGALDTLLNQPKVEAVLARIAEVYATRMRGKLGHVPEARRQVISNSIDLLMNPQNLFNLSYQDQVSMFHYFHGFETGLNDTISFKDTFSNLVGGPLVQARGLTYVSSVDTTTYECQFVVEKIAEPESLMPMLKDYHVRIYGSASLPSKSTKRSKKKQPDGWADLEGSLWQKSTYFIDLRTGWPTFIRQVQEVEIINKKTGTSEVTQNVWTFEPEPKK